MGSVEILDCMGDDLMVVNAARVSFEKESYEMTLGDQKLISYLAKHNHVTPFFHPQIQFRIRMPLFVAREWYRHQIGFSRNEVSRRYVDSQPECWIPEIIRERDINKKQGSKETEVYDTELSKQIFEKSIKDSVAHYNCLISMNVAPELARTVLPQSMYTEFIETGSLAAYARLYKLRTTSDAQREIQWYANEIGKHLETKFPISWKALTTS